MTLKNKLRSIKTPDILSKIKKKKKINNTSINNNLLSSNNNNYNEIHNLKNKMTKDISMSSSSSGDVSIFYYLIIFSIMLNCVAYIPFIVKIYDTKTTYNIPYTTLFLQLVAYLIIVAIGISKKYYIQSLFFIIFLASILYILFLKIKHQRKD